MIEEIEARLKRATPGPWERHDLAPDVIMGCSCVVCKKVKKVSNAVFIANAPTDIAWLLAEVKRLTTSLLEDD